METLWFYVWTSLIGLSVTFLLIYIPTYLTIKSMNWLNDEKWSHQQQVKFLRGLFPEKIEIRITR